jgi:hypothetical protein
MCFNRFKSSGNYIRVSATSALILCVSTGNVKAFWFLCCKNWILKCYFRQVWLYRVKAAVNISCSQIVSSTQFITKHFSSDEVISQNNFSFVSCQRLGGPRPLTCYVCLFEETFRNSMQPSSSLYADTRSAVHYITTSYAIRRFITVLTKAATGPRPEPDESSSHPHTMFL